MFKSVYCPLLVTILLALASPSLAAAEADAVFITTGAEGSVMVDGKVVMNGAEIFPGSRVTTGPKGKVILRDANQNGVFIGPNSKLVIRREGAKTRTTIQLSLGKAWSFLLNALPVQYEVVTQHAVAGVRGTIFLVEATEEATYICSCSGSVEVSSAKTGDFENIVTTKAQAHRGIAVKAVKGTLTQEPVERHSHTDDEAKSIMAELAK